MKKLFKTKKIISLLVVILTTTMSFSQVGIGTNTPNTSSILDLTSTDKAFLPPRMTPSQRDAIAAPSEGMVIFNITTQCVEVYNATEVVWKSLCGDEASTSAIYEPICNSLSVNGTYFTGVALDSGTNFITLNVDVSEIGTYAIVCDSGGMVFTSSGTFTTYGIQQITLRGQGYPANVGLNYLSFVINDTVCSAIVNVQNGAATVTSCGTTTLNTAVVAGQTYTQGDIVASISGITYSGGAVYGIGTTTVNGVALTTPLQGSFSSVSPATLEIDITGTPLVPGNTVINYEINEQTGCSFTFPVVSGTGFVNGLNCSGGALSGTYQAAQAMTAANTKVLGLANVTTIGTFNIRTPEVNGVYFSGSYTAAAIGPQNVTLTATGTPLASGTFSYTVTVSATATTFITCTFNVTFSNPSSFPDFTTSQCAPLDAANYNYTYVKAPNTQASDFFAGHIDGYTIENRLSYGPYAENGNSSSVKMSADGLTLVVGAMGEDATTLGGQLNNANALQGAAYVYTRTSTTAKFTFQGYLKALVGDAGDWFGNSVDISNDGNTVIVGATGEDSNGTGVNSASTTNNAAAISGAAYIFTRTGVTWSQLAYLKANNTAAADYFGYSVAVSGDGNRFAVGAPYEDGSSIGINGVDNNTAGNAGAVYTYTRSGATVTFEARIKSNNIGAADYFGASVDLNNTGTTLAVGATHEDGSGVNVNPANNNNATIAGAAYVFFHNGTTWAQQAYLKASNTTANQLFGYDVSLSGTGSRLVVGAAGEDGTLVASTGATDSGAAYLFERTGTTWAAKQRLKADNFGAADGFGFRVQYSNDGSSVAIGAPFEDTSIAAATCPTFTPNNTLADSGAVYLFRDNVSAFIQSAFLKMRTEVTAAAGMTATDNSGYSVGLSGDGKSVAVGMPGEDGSSTTVNGAINNGAALAGAVMIFTAP